MPVISCFYGISIYFYFEDHNPPHFHAKYNEFEALISIENLVVIKGYLPGRALSLIIEWAIQHKAELWKDWDLTKENFLPNRIEPLK